MEYTRTSPHDSGQPATTRDEHRDDRNPMLRLTGLVPRLPRYIKLGYRLLRDPDVPAGSKALLGLAIGYTVSPINLIPTFIPVAGQLDDLLALLFGLRQALRACPAERRDSHLDAAGVTLETIDSDLRLVRQAGLWLARRPLAWGLSWVRDRLGGRSARAGRPKEQPTAPLLLDRPAERAALPPGEGIDRLPGDQTALR